jgi:hypothetical protein
MTPHSLPPCPGRPSSPDSPFDPTRRPGRGPQTLDLRIYASTTTQSVAGLSRTFADNIGPDHTLVFSGPLTLLTANLPGPGNTRQFDIAFSFTTPFRYDPRAGNLLIEFQTFSVSGVQVQRDLVSGDPSVNVVAAPSPTATTGNVAGYGLVAQLTFQPVPEPGTLMLVGIGTAGLIGSRWRWRKRA